MKHLLSLAFLMLFVCLVKTKLTCMDESGQPVDMFVAYKFPRMEDDDKPPLVQEGHGYAYLDSNRMIFTLSQLNISYDQNAAASTLDQVYSKYNKLPLQYKKTGPSNIAHVFYNDEDPDSGKEYFYNGHTKGALAFDEDSGFWMIHSIPKYPPPASEGYSYPHSGCMYGQMFMCITFNASLFNDIGTQLRYNNPHVHSGNLPSSWQDEFPSIKRLLDGDMIKDEPYSNLVHLQSMSGDKFQHFAKSNDFHKDLYRDFVAPTLQTNILTETWQHGHNINSSCETEYTVEDITDIDAKMSTQDIGFDSFKDHSKFVVSKSSEKPYVCVGDINRQPSQFKRGGGTMCTENSALWEQFHGLVTDYNSCDQNNEQEKQEL